MPTTGNVVANYLGGNVVQNAPMATRHASTCYNNSTNTYSTNVSNGSGPTVRCRSDAGRGAVT